MCVQDEVVDAAARQPAWWQVDLGATALVDHVNVWHRTDCCQDRLMSAHVMLGLHGLDAGHSGCPGALSSSRTTTVLFAR